MKIDCPACHSLRSVDEEGYCTACSRLVYGPARTSLDAIGGPGCKVTVPFLMPPIFLMPPSKR